MYSIITSIFYIYSYTHIIVFLYIINNLNLHICLFPVMLHGEHTFDVRW